MPYTLASWLHGVQDRVIDFPGGEGQCVDLVNDYITSVWGERAVRLNAADWRNAFLNPRQWRWEPNAPTNYPPAGAVVVWSTPVPQLGIGPDGHVSVALLADSMRIFSIDQNWSGRAAAEFSWHSYTGVAGWWRPLLNPLEH